MKLLVFSDVHSEKRYIDPLVKLAKKEKPDFLICAGDLADWGQNIVGLAKEFDKLDIPMILIPGNHEENEEDLKKLIKETKNIIYLHSGSYEVNDIIFFGYGGGGFSKIDPVFERIMNKFKKTVKDKKVIFVTHAPVFETKTDYIPGLGHVGDKSILKAIKEIKPILVVCGHIHDSAGTVDRVGDTVIVNPGPVGKIIELEF